MKPQMTPNMPLPQKKGLGGITGATMNLPLGVIITMYFIMMKITIYKRDCQINNSKEAMMEHCDEEFEKNKKNGLDSIYLFSEMYLKTQQEYTKMQEKELKNLSRDFH